MKDKIAMSNAFMTRNTKQPLLVIASGKKRVDEGIPHVVLKLTGDDLVTSTGGQGILVTDL